MEKVLSNLVFWPSKEQVLVTKLNRYRHLTDLVAITGCSEIFIETPKDPLLQAATWSDYKHHNTGKFLALPLITYHQSLHFVVPIPVLHILDIEANRFYDRNQQMYDAVLLTRCYTRHALRPFIDAEINHQRHFIKLPFMNKGMDFIDLPSIFQHKSVTSSIPVYFQNSDQKHDLQF